MNTSKTTGLWLGKWKNREDKPCGFKWNSDTLIIWGIFVGNNVTPADNWEPRINKIKCVLNKYKQRNLTLTGKSVIVNIMVSNSLNYLGSVISCPEDWIKKIEDVVYRFYWSGKPEKSNAPLSLDLETWGELV